MRVVDAKLDDCLDVQVDPDASPADWDRALAKFLLAYVRTKSRSTPGPSAAEQAEHHGLVDTADTGE